MVQGKRGVQMGPGRLYLHKSVFKSLEHKIDTSMFYSLLYVQSVRLYHRHCHLIGSKGSNIGNFTLVIHVYDFSS